MLWLISWEQAKGDAPAMEPREKQDAAVLTENSTISEPPVTGYRLRYRLTLCQKPCPLDTGSKAASALLSPKPQHSQNTEDRANSALPIVRRGRGGVGSSGQGGMGDMGMHLQGIGTLATPRNPLCFPAKWCVWRSQPAWPKRATSSLFPHLLCHIVWVSSPSPDATG